MDPRILKAEPYYNNGSNKVFLLLKIYRLLYLEFLEPFFPSGREKVNPYFRENESSEASGIRHPLHVLPSGPVSGSLTPAIEF